MTSALGVLKWTPDVLWRATMYEYTAAMKGHLLSKGIKLDGAMSRSEFLDMKREDEAREKLKRKQET
jgi:hypothetical protein